MYQISEFQQHSLDANVDCRQLCIASGKDIAIDIARERARQRITDSMSHICQCEEVCDWIHVAHEIMACVSGSELIDSPPETLIVLCDKPVFVLTRCPIPCSTVLIVICPLLITTSLDMYHNTKPLRV